MSTAPQYSPPDLPRPAKPVTHRTTTLLSEDEESRIKAHIIRMVLDEMEKTGMVESCMQRAMSSKSFTKTHPLMSFGDEKRIIERVKRALGRAR